MENVEVFEIFDDNISKDTYDWERVLMILKNILSKHIIQVIKVRHNCTAFGYIISSKIDNKK